MLSRIAFFRNSGDSKSEITAHRPATWAGDGPDGQVCTNVAISGSTEDGRYFPDYQQRIGDYL